MTSAIDPSATSETFRFLGHDPMPSTIPTDLRALLDLNETARASFAEILGPCLEPKLSEDTDRLIDAFCRKYEAIGNRVALALRGARYVIWEGARANASASDLAAAIAALVGDGADRISKTLTPVYEVARDRIRADIVRRTFLEHGAYLTSVDWRIDRVTSSQHGRALEAEIAVVTLGYRDGNDVKRVSLQCDAAMVQRLGAVCEALRKNAR